MLTHRQHNEHEYSFSLTPHSPPFCSGNFFPEIISDSYPFNFMMFMNVESPIPT